MYVLYENMHAQTAMSVREGPCGIFRVTATVYHLTFHPTYDLMQLGITNLETCPLMKGIS